MNNLSLIPLIRELRALERNGELEVRRYCCAHCGATWIEISGILVQKREGKDCICLRLGKEMSCLGCSAPSHDIFEISCQENPLRCEDDSLPTTAGFTEIKRVDRPNTPIEE